MTTTSTIILIAVIILGIIFFRKRNSMDSTLKSVANLDDHTLSSNEKRTANILRQIVGVIKEQPSAKFHPEMNYNGVIDEIATEVFKCGIWRLNDKNLANKYFQNPGYIQVNKKKFKDDLDEKINENYFVSQNDKSFEKYILFWVLKFRNETKKIDTFLN